MFQLGPVLALTAIGDSKTRGLPCCEADGGARRYLLEGLTQPASWGHAVYYGDSNSYWYGAAGQTSVTVAASINATLAGMTGTQDPEWLLLNLGANDLSGGTTQAAYETAMGEILDAAKAKWPSLKSKVMRPWRRGYDAQSATMATWVANVVSTRSAWASTGPDEAVFLKSSDDGATYTDDGLHPNLAGYTLTAAQWQAAMGY